MSTYRTQSDALSAICRMLQPAKSPLTRDLLSIAEHGLSIKPTPAQNNADALVGYLFDYADMLDKLADGACVDKGFAQTKRAEISELCDLLRPSPPTLEEALDVLRGLFDVTHGYDAAKPNHVKARQLLARVPK